MLAQATFFNNHSAAVTVAGHETTTYSSGRSGLLTTPTFDLLGWFSPAQQRPLMHGSLRRGGCQRVHRLCHVGVLGREGLGPMKQLAFLVRAKNGIRTVKSCEALMPTRKRRPVGGSKHGAR